jgi:hypothetical protein
MVWIGMGEVGGRLGRLGCEVRMDELVKIGLGKLYGGKKIGPGELWRTWINTPSKGNEECTARTPGKSIQPKPEKRAYRQTRKSVLPNPRGDCTAKP